MHLILQLSKIKNIVKIVNGKDNLTKDGTVPVYGSSATPFGFTNKIMYDKDTVLLGRKGTIDKPQFIAEPFWAVDTAFYTIPKKNADLKFFYYCMTVLDYKKYTYGSAIPSMSQGILNEISLPYPILKEQQKIAAFLDKKTAQIDSILADTKQSIVEFKKYKQALITETVTMGLNTDVKTKDSGIEWIGEIPEHWKLSRLKKIVKSPLQYGANESGEAFNEDEPRYIRITDITIDNKLKATGKLSLPLSIAKPYILADNDILFARSGATVGKTFLFKSEYGMSAFAGYLIKASILDNISAEYIYYYTLSYSYEKWKEQIFIQSTIQNIGADRYSNLQIPIPMSREEQQQIVEYLDEKCAHIDNLIADKEKLLSEFEDYKKSLIYEYVTGKKDVE